MHPDTLRAKRAPMPVSKFLRRMLALLRISRHLEHYGMRANIPIRIRIVGAVTTRSFSAQLHNGSLRWIKTVCVHAQLKRRAMFSTNRHGAKADWFKCLRITLSGAFRDSARGARRFRRYVAPRVMNQHWIRELRARLQRVLQNLVLMSGGVTTLQSIFPKVSYARSAVRRRLKKRRTSLIFGLSRA